MCSSCGRRLLLLLRPPRPWPWRTAATSGTSAREAHGAAAPGHQSHTFPPWTKPINGDMAVRSGRQNSISSWLSFSTTRFDSQASDDSFVPDKSVTASIFNVYKDPETNLLNIGHMLSEIEKSGIRRFDNRLQGLMRNINEHHEKLGQDGTLPDAMNVDFDTFQRLADEHIIIMSQIFGRKQVIPEFEDFCKHIREIFLHCKPLSGGKVADYIPQLARYDPKLWACSICTVDGQRFSIGDVKTTFTLQSTSKPFTYAIVLNELGPEKVHKHVSYEPSGRNFNEICLDSRNKPHNPMLNSGAIMISACSLALLKPEMRLAEKFDYMQNYLKRIAGGETIGFNNSVFLSERDTADRNFAMAYFMREHKAFPPNTNLQECMDLYFQFCSLEVDTEGLAVMGATLANGGICPTTGEKVLSASCVRDVLSLMYSCGMYNYSGQFAFHVGLPAKSGVSGALVVVVPNVVSIALFSPALDKIGNSVRGLEFCKELVERFNFHRFDNLRYSEKKLDPRKHRHEALGMSTVTLLFAATSGDVSSLKRHYIQGVDLNQGDYDGRTALHVAAAEGQLECVKFLLGTANVYSMPKDRWNFTPLDEAKRFGHEKVALYINEYINLEHE